MRRYRRQWGLLVLAGVLGVGLAGCGRVTGGGWIDSAGGIGKATFSGQMRSMMDRAGNPAFAGEFEYDDHSVKINGQPVRLHCSVDSGFVLEVDDGFGHLGHLGVFTGAYRRQPSASRPDGLFEVDYLSWDDRGPSPGDSVFVGLTGGAFDGYVNQGLLRGGSLQSHAP